MKEGLTQETGIKNCDHLLPRKLEVINRFIVLLGILSMFTSPSHFPMLSCEAGLQLFKQAQAQCLPTVIHGTGSACTNNTRLSVTMAPLSTLMENLMGLGRKQFM